MRIRILTAVVVALFASPRALPDATVSIAAALHQTLRQTDATAIVLDVESNRILAVEHANRAAEIVAAPGSVLKPFYLRDALEAGVVQPKTAVYCSRTLYIAGHRLNCGHPAEPASLDAREALAYSCNTYFATLAQHMTSQQILDALHRYGIGASTGLFAQEAVAQMATPGSVEARQLFVLGITGIAVTPAQVAAAYRRLAVEQLHRGGGPAADAVWQGLEDSVRYGTSDTAAVAGLNSAGKTGTASNQNSARTHGWFVGMAPADAPRIVLVVYLPYGTGADAAALAHRFYLAARLGLQ